MSYTIKAQFIIVKRDDGRIICATEPSIPDISIVDLILPDGVTPADISGDEDLYHFIHDAGLTIRVEMGPAPDDSHPLPGTFISDHTITKLFPDVDSYLSWVVTHE